MATLALFAACHGGPEPRSPGQPGGRDEGDGGAAGSPQAGGTGGRTGTGGALAENPYRFNFELDEQYWQDLTRAPFAGLPPVRSMDHAFEGDWSLRYRIETTGVAPDGGVTVDSGAPLTDDERVVGVVGSDIGALTPGQSLLLRLWVPDGHGLSFVQAFMQTRMAGSWVADMRAGNLLVAGTWNAFRLRVPASYADAEPLEFGFYLRTAGPWRGDIYIDAVELESQP